MMKNKMSTNAHPTEPSRFGNHKKPYKLSYGTGNVEGNLAKDKICFDKL